MNDKNLILREIDFLNLSKKELKQLEKIPTKSVRQHRNFALNQKDFLNQCGNVEFLSREDIACLFKEIYFHVAKIRDIIKSKNSDIKIEDVMQDIKPLREAVEELYLSHRALLIKVANKFKWIGDNLFEDVMQEGAIALLRAIRKYNPCKNVSFLVYAKKVIYNALKDTVNDIVISHTLLAPYPDYSLEKIVEFTNSFEAENNRSPSSEEISSALKLPINIVKNMQFVIKKMRKLVHPMASLDKQDNDGVSLHDVIYGENKLSQQTSAQYNQLVDEINNLSSPYKEVLTMHLIEDRSYREISSIYKLTASRIQQIAVKGISMLRNKLDIGA